MAASSSTMALTEHTSASTPATYFEAYLATFRTLEGYHAAKHDILFTNVIKNLITASIMPSVITEMAEYPYGRFHPHILAAGTADNAYQILNFISFYLQDNLSNKSHLPATLKLFGSCPISLSTLLNISGTEQDLGEAVDFREFRKMFAPLEAKSFKSFDANLTCNESNIGTKKSDSSHLQAMQRHLYTKGIYVDNQGNVYKDPAHVESKAVTRLANSQSKAANNGLTLSLIDALNYEFIYRYIFIYEILSRGPHRFIFNLEPYGVFTREVFNTFKPLLDVLTPAYHMQNHQRLSQFLNNNQLCLAILEEKSNSKETLSSAFSKLDITSNLLALIREEHLFYLLTFHYNTSLINLRRVWPETQLPGLLTMFIKTNLDKPQDKRSRELQLASPHKDKEIKKIWELILGLTEYFDDNHKLEFVLGHFSTLEKRKYLSELYKQHCKTLDDQTKWLATLSDTTRNRVVALFKEYRLHLIPSPTMPASAASSSTATILTATPVSLSSSSSAHINNSDSARLQPSFSMLMPSPSTAFYPALDPVIRSSSMEPLPAFAPWTMSDGGTVLTASATPIPTATATPIDMILDSKDVSSTTIFTTTSDTEDKKALSSSHAKLQSELKKYSTRSIATDILLGKLVEYKELYIGDAEAKEDINDAKEKARPTRINNMLLREKRREAHLLFRITLQDIADHNSKSGWQALYRLYQKSSFKDQAGWYDTKKLLAGIRAPNDSLWKVVHDLEDKIEKQTAFFKKFAKDALLTQLFSDNQYWPLAPEDLAIIFQHCNKTLFTGLALTHNRLQYMDGFFQCISTYDALQEAFYKQFNNAQLLESTLTNLTIFKSLTSYDLQHIFKHSDKNLFFSFITLEHLAYWKSFSPIPTLELTRDTMERFLSADIDFANEIRHRLQIPILVLDGYVRAGLDGLADGSEILSNENAYQLQDMDVHNMDRFLVNAYKSVLGNRFPIKETKAMPQDSTTPEKKEHTPSVIFYHIPATIQPTLHRINFSEIERAVARSTTARVPGIKADDLMAYRFLKKIKHLVDTFKPVAFFAFHNKPMIFTTWLNTNRNHYIPCFIYKNLDGKIQIKTLDPSPAIKLEVKDEERTVQHMIHDMFKAIFPDCDYEDLNQSQQIRQRDCGFRTASVFETAFQYTNTNTPFVTVTESGLMQFNVNLLPLRFNEQPWRIQNKTNGYFYYSPAATQSAVNDRARWANRLREMKEVMFLPFQDDHTIETLMAFNEEFHQEYNYDINVAKQTHHDQLGELKSRVAIYLQTEEMKAALKRHGIKSTINVENADIEAFKNSLALPELKEMPLYVRALQEAHQEYQKIYGHEAGSSINIVDEIRQKGRDLGEDAGDLRSPEEFLKFILTENLKPHYAEAIQNQFNKFLRNYRIKNIEDTPQNATNIFLSLPAIRLRYKELPDSDKNVLNTALIMQATAAFNTKLPSFCEEKLNKLLIAKLHLVLKRLPCKNDSNDDTQLNDIIAELKNFPDYQKEVSYLETHHIILLKTLITKEINQIMAECTRSTLEHLRQQMQSCTLESLPQPPLGQKISLLQPAVIELLPSTADKPYTVIRSDIPVTDPESKTAELKHSLFSAKLVARVDTATHERSLENMYLNSLKHILKHEISTIKPKALFILQSYSLNALSNLYTHPEQLQMAARDLGIYRPLESIQNNPARYHFAAEQFTTPFREAVRESLQNKMHEIFNIFAKAYHKIGKEKLIALFAHLNAAENIDKAAILRSVIHDLLNLTITPEVKTIIGPILPAKTLTDLERQALSQFAGAENAAILDSFANIFSEHFVKCLEKIKKTQRIWERQITEQMNFMQRISTYFEQVCEEKVPPVSHIRELIVNCQALEIRIKAYQYLSQEQIQDEFNQCDKLVQQSFLNLVQLLLTELRKNPGDVTPNKTTGMARVFLTQILGQAIPQYISGGHAWIIDQEIERRISTINALPHTMRECVPPVVVTPTPVPPLTYGQRLTPLLLGQLVANWLCAYDAKLLPQQMIPSTVLRDLYKRLQNMPPQDPTLPLPTLWCKQELEPWLFSTGIKQAMQSKDEPFLFALMHCENFSPTQPQEIKRGNNICLSHFEDILALYHRKPLVHNHGMRALTQETKGAPLTERKEDVVSVSSAEALIDPDLALKPLLDVATIQIGATTNIGFFQKGKGRAILGTSTNDMDIFAACIANIKRRRGVSGNIDFSLDLGELQLLKALLHQRWHTFSKDHKDELKTSYGFEKASQANYILIALMLKKAYENFGITTTAYQLLMPGRVTVGQVEDEELYITYDIDVFNWKANVCLLGNQWFPKSELLRIYKETGNLVNPLTKAPLTPAELKSIVSNYPDIRGQLLALFLTKYRLSVLKHNLAIKAAFVKFIKNGVMRYIGSHNKAQDVQGTGAWLELMGFITALPNAERENLMQTTVPGSKETLEAYIARNQSQNRDANACITWFGKEFALLVLHHYPDTDINEFGAAAVSYWGDVFKETAQSIKRQDATNLPGDLSPTEQVLGDIVKSTFIESKVTPTFRR
jgi:hypothetical protein